MTLNYDKTTETIMQIFRDPFFLKNDSEMELKEIDF